MEINRTIIENEKFILHLYETFETINPQRIDMKQLKIIDIYTYEVDEDLKYIDLDEILMDYVNQNVDFFNLICEFEISFETSIMIPFISKSKSSVYSLKAPIISSPDYIGKIKFEAPIYHDRTSDSFDNLRNDFHSFTDTRNIRAVIIKYSGRIGNRNLRFDLPNLELIVLHIDEQRHINAINTFFVNNPSLRCIVFRKNGFIKQKNDIQQYSEETIQEFMNENYNHFMKKKPQKKPYF